MTERRENVPTPGSVANRIGAQQRSSGAAPKPANPSRGQERREARGGSGRAPQRKQGNGANGVAPGRDHRHDYRAVAPYGLVPLPETPMPAEALQAAVLGEGLSQRDLLRSHDRRVPGTHTGWIDVEVRTLTPLFVGATQDEDREKLNRSLLIDGAPAIPGSSLRGLVRNHLRLLTGGETGPVNTPRLFFRAPASSHEQPRTQRVMKELHRLYKERRHGMPPSPPGQPVRAGFLRREPDGWRIHPLATKRPLQIRLVELKEDFEERFSDLPPFQLPPDPTQEEKKEKWDNYLPAEYHRDFQYLKVTALCPDLSKWRGPAAEYHEWAMAVIPPGTKVGQTAKERVWDRLDAHWVKKQEKAFEKLEKNADDDQAGKRYDAFQQARDAIETIPVREVPSILVLTGIAGKRENAYLFPLGGSKPALEVPETLVRLVESADQITQFQERNFPEEKAIAALAKGERSPKRPQVRDGKYGSLARNTPEPVWYRTDDAGKVVSFGRSGGYRVAVRGIDGDPIREAVPDGVLSPAPAEGRGRTVDVPRALFGDIDLFDEKVPAARGRVSFGAATSTDDAYEYPHPLRVELLKPGRTCFANYLLQTAPDKWGERPTLITWAHEGDVRLGGYKVYLHRHDGEERYAEMRPGEGGPGDTQRDVQPLRAGLTFRGRITFSNLTPAELGGLLRALLLDNPVDGGDPRDPAYAHKIGMGKSLGLGSVHIRPRLYLVDAEKRAASLDPHAGIHTATPEEVRGYLAAFDTALLEWEKAPSLRSVPRIEALRLATQWHHRLPWECTRPMSLEEYGRYPVLPSIAERFDHCGKQG